MLNSIEHVYNTCSMHVCEELTFREWEQDSESIPDTVGVTISVCVCGGNVSVCVSLCV